MSLRLCVLALTTTASVGSLGLGLAACESATNLDVKYGDASAALEGSAGEDADALAPRPGDPILPGCPCDESAGQGCCMAPGGKPFCTADENVCTVAKGTFLRCVRPDPLTESVCCWNSVPKMGAIAALASACDGGPAACQGDSDCTGGAACNLQECFDGKIKVGACGPVKPECPPK